MMNLWNKVFGLALALTAFIWITSLSIHAHAQGTDSPTKWYVIVQDTDKFHFYFICIDEKCETFTFDRGTAQELAAFYRLQANCSNIDPKGAHAIPEIAKKRQVEAGVLGPVPVEPKCV